MGNILKVSDSEKAKTSAAEDDRSNKRRRIHESLPASIHSLPDAVLQVCFSFVGPGHYFYVAGVDRRFRKVYETEHNKSTKWIAAGSSVSCAKLCIEDAKEQGKEESKAFNKVTFAASMMGCLTVLEWAHNNGCEFNECHFAIAAASGSLNVLRWADAKGFQWFTENVLFMAIRFSMIKSLEYFYENDHAIDPDYATKMAARYGQLSVLLWLKGECLLYVGEDSWIGPAMAGHIHILDWFFHDGHRPNAREDDLLLVACMLNDQRDTILWARDHGIHCYMKACAMAAKFGDLSMLQWLRENDFAWDGRVLGLARREDHEHVLEWAIANGCPTEIFPWPGDE